MLLYHDIINDINVSNNSKGNNNFSIIFYKIRFSTLRRKRKN